MANLQRGIKRIEATYGSDHLNLVLAVGYVRSLLANDAIGPVPQEILPGTAGRVGQDLRSHGAGIGGRRIARQRRPAPIDRPVRHGGATAGLDGDPDPTSAGTAGDAALWGGSSAAVGMAANPFGAHQAGRHRAGREGGRSAAALVAWRCSRSFAARVRLRLPHRANPTMRRTHHYEGVARSPLRLGKAES